MLNYQRVSHEYPMKLVLSHESHPVNSLMVEPPTVAKPRQSRDAKKESQPSNSMLYHVISPFPTLYHLTSYIQYSTWLING